MKALIDALGHQAQQQRVHLRARAVDLVEEEDGEVAAVADDGPRLDARASVLADVGVIDHVGGHEVDRAFDTLVCTPETARRGAQQRRLADADVAFEKHVAARKNGDGQQAYDAPLPDDDLGQLAFELAGALAPGREVDRVEIPDRLHAFAGQGDTPVRGSQTCLGR